MKLGEYLTTNSIQPSAFAAQMGVDKSLVGRWSDGSVIPRRHNLKRITELTAGQVTANDFIGVQESIPNPNGQEGPAVAQG